MKKTFSVLLVLALVLAFAAPIAGAADVKNIGKGFATTVGRVLILPFTPLIAVGETIKKGKPSNLVLIPDAVRKGAFDVVESAGRTVVAAEPLAAAPQIAGGENGSVNTVITDAGLDWLVTGAFWGGLVGPLVFNNAAATTTHLLAGQAWTAGVATAVGTAGATAGGQALDAAGY